MRRRGTLLKGIYYLFFLFLFAALPPKIFILSLSAYARLSLLLESKVRSLRRISFA